MKAKPILIYTLRSLGFDRGIVFRFKQPALFVPESRQSASVVIGANGWPNANGGEPDHTLSVIRRIEYSISCLSSVCVTEVFAHDVKKRCRWISKGNFHNIQGEPLFTFESANFLLKSKAFPGVRAVQFVC